MKKEKELQPRFAAIFIILSAVCAISYLAISIYARNTNEYDYGVFLSCGAERMDEMVKYKTVVTDAQYLSTEDISYLHAHGCRVLSYINIGSVEDFRDYYDRYEPYTLGEYEHWDEERWVDVSCREWQDFLIYDLAPSLLDKGIDGLFVDNADVYYLYHREDIFEGVTAILKGFKSYGTYVCINGGDVYVKEYLAGNCSFDEVLDAVNQESVFTSIDWEHERFGRSSREDREYFTKYIDLVAAAGGDVYLLEYTKSPFLAFKIRSYCRDHGYRFYISDSLELD